jgi:hypothetical protein
MFSLSFSWQRIYNKGTTTVSLNYTLQILHTKSSLLSRPYRTELSTELCTTPLHDGFVSLIHGFSTTIDFSESESNVTTDVQSASLSWNKTPIWGLRPNFYFCQTVAGLLMWDAVSDERTGLSFTITAGPRQRNHFRVRVPWDS